MQVEYFLSLLCSSFCSHKYRWHRTYVVSKGKKETRPRHSIRAAAGGEEKKKRKKKRTIGVPLKDDEFSFMYSKHVESRVSQFMRRYDKSGRCENGFAVSGWMIALFSYQSIIR